MRIIPVAVPLLLIGCLFALAVPSRADEPSSPKASAFAAPAALTLKILAASFLYGGESADVTERVKSLLRDDTGFTVNPDYLGADPHPGARKAFVIFCEIDGKSAVFTTGESEDVSRVLILKNARFVTQSTDALVAPPSDVREAYGSAAAMLEALEVFRPIEIVTNAAGGPVSQSVTMNDRVVEFEGRRYSGFRFVVNRTEAASRQKVADKEKLHLFWYFVPPQALNTWYILPVKGRMRGFSEWFPLQLSSFKHTEYLLPKAKDEIIVQHLAADRITDGQEYVIWFSCDEKITEPLGMTIAIGYRADKRNFHVWQDLTSVVKFLGLTPAKDTIGIQDKWNR